MRGRRPGGDRRGAAAVAMTVRAALLVHGAGGGGWEWSVWRGVLAAAGLAVDAPDLQPSARGLASTGLEAYADQVAAALSTLPRPRALVGASLGGLLATMRAEAADALVLVNPLPPDPWHARLAPREWPDVVPWRQGARLASTRRALPDADAATALYAFRRWRDESGLALRQAHAGIRLSRPACPVLCLASLQDDEVPADLTCALASAWDADLLRLAGASHVGPLLGRGATAAAAAVLAWLQAQSGAGSGRPAEEGGPG